MRRLFAIAISLILLTSCAKDFYYIFGMDVDAPISVELSGSRYEWDNELFTSDSGYYSHYNHPDLVLHDDGGFSFELNRGLGSEVGKDADLVARSGFATYKGDRQTGEMTTIGFITHIENIDSAKLAAYDLSSYMKEEETQ